MWVGVGIVSFLVFFGYRLWRKRYWAWGWTDEGFLEIDRQYFRARRRRNGSIAYAVVCPPGFYFRLKRESWFDRLAKRIGLSVEHQLADPDFDERLYLVSNDTALISELINTPPLRQVLKTMFRDGNLQRITCEGRHLWVELQHAPEPDALRGPEAKTIVAALHAISHSLSTLAERHGQRKRDPYALRAIVLVALASALLMLAVLELYHVLIVDRQTIILDGWVFLGVSSSMAMLCLLLLLAIAILLLRGSSYAHVVVLEILVSGGLGLFISSYALLRDINLEWDQAESTPYAITVVDKQALKKRRRSGRSYKLYLEVPNRAGTARVIWVDGRTYSRAIPGEQMLLFVKPGALGFRWIEKIQPDK